MDEAPGAAQDALTDQKWLERVLAKHGIRQWNPPSASCRCGGWQRSAPPDFGVIRQRDWLLDAFLEHQSLMRREKRKWIEARKARRGF